MNLLYLIVDLNLELVSLLKIVDVKQWKRKIYDKNEDVEFAFRALFLEDNKIIKLNIEGDKFEIEGLLKIYADNQDKLIFYFERQGEKSITIEYLNRWLTLQKIFNALNKQTLLQPKYYRPYLDLILSKLPKQYQKKEANLGDVLKVEIVGEAGGVWCIVKKDEGWVFTEEMKLKPKSLIYIDQQIAWLLFSGGINPMYASQYYQIHGDVNLGSHVLKMKSIMM
jgi:hypothetical protein